MSKKKRKAKRPWSVETAVEQVSRVFRLTEATWHEAIEHEIIPRGPWRAKLASYVATHGDSLGPRWAALLVAFWQCSFRREDRVVALHGALSVYPPCGFVENLLGEQLLLHYGRILRARKQLSLAVALEPDMASAHYHLAQAHHLLGMMDRAVEQFEAAVRRAGDSDYEREIAARSLFNLAAILVNSGGDHDRATALLRRALDHMSDYPEAEETLHALEAHARTKGRRSAPSPAEEDEP